ncbi:MAG: hypothetical protein NUV80_05530 [Candidatus Berkelbacteria bacterium]|nr:hypothetical protein [Candidatus Berkelbacteria bacterium]
MSRSEINTDPTEGDFFNVDALPNLADALVRESIQNSLDAGSDYPEKPVLVKIRVSTEDEALNQNDLAQFFNGLQEHIAVTPIISSPPAATDKCVWIAVEDFETRGLVGDVQASEDPTDGRNDFYYFWRNVGRGKKEGSDRGRWGLGKTMFPASSRIHTFFGLSVSENTSTPLLMGQSVLQIHHIDGKKHYPYGYFGQVDPIDGFVTPITDEDIILDFVETFKLSRITEPGLSVVIPYPRESIGKDEIIRSIIHHYFFPILNGGLVLEVNYGVETIELSSMNLMEYTNKIFDDDEYAFKGMLSLTSKFLAMNNKEMFTARAQPPRAAPKWSDELFTGESLESMTALLDDCEAVAIRIPVHVVPKGDEPRASYFHVVLERDPDLEVPKDIFVRQGITVSGVTSLRDAGVRALVVAEDSELATFLGDAENPAHTEWQERSRKFKGKYFPGPATLSFVKEAPRQIMRLLNRHAEHVDDTALRHIFPAPEDEGAPRRKNRAEPKSNPTKTRIPSINPVPRKQKIQVSSISGGFSIVLTDYGKQAVPVSIAIKCAYDTSKGNPFKKWSPADFTLESMQSSELEGGTILTVSDNVLKVQATDPEFWFHLGGFDQNRDLITEARVVTENA